MNSQRTNQVSAVRWLSTLLLFGALFTLLCPAGAWAVGTPSGTTISNQATISYDVGGEPQVDIDSDGDPGAPGVQATDFLVDNRIDVTVASLGDTTVSTDEDDASLGYTVTNVGNTMQGYFLEAVAGTTDIPMSGVEIYIEDGTTPGFQAGEDTLYTPGTNAGDLDPNPPAAPASPAMTVYIVADAPATATNGDTDTYWLRAVTLDAGTTTITTNDAGSPDTAGVDDIFADGDGDAGAIDDSNDGRHVASGMFTIMASYLTVSKTQSVIYDPVSGGTDPHAIPGAYVRYVITITNGSGAAPATLTTLADVLQAELTFEPDLRDSADSPESGPGDGFRVDGPAGRGWGASHYFTTASDADGMEYDGTDTVSADFTTVLPAEAGYAAGELRADETVTIQFNAVVD